MRIEFTVPAIPVAQPRQRQTVLAGHVHGYTPARHPVNAFKAAVALSARGAYDGPPLEGAVRVSLLFVFPRPRVLVWKRRPMLRTWHTSRPDCENVIKSFLDALTGLVWHDDAQVSELHAVKAIAAGSEQPHVEVCVEALEEVRS